MFYISELLSKHSLPIFISCIDFNALLHNVHVCALNHSGSSISQMLFVPLKVATEQNLEVENCLLVKITL